MHHFIAIAFILIPLGWMGCAHAPKPKPVAPATTLLPSVPAEEVPALNAVVNDKTKSQEERARAVYRLLAHQVRPGASATDFRHALTNPSWVEETHLYAGNELSGRIPVEVTAEDTVFAVHLFPEPLTNHRSPWVIYLRLTGRFLQYEDAIAFLRGERASWNPKLVEYALAFPDGTEPGKPPKRVEVFSAEGLRVYESR